MTLTNVFLPHREERRFQGFLYKGISSWPLKVHPRAVCKDMYINGGTFSENHEGYESNPVRALMYSICKAKCPRHSVQVYTTNILYIFT